MLEAILLKDRVVIWDFDKAKNLYNKKSFGKLKEDRLELALIEAAYLLDKKKISIKDRGKMRFSDFFEYCKKIDPRFKYKVVTRVDNADYVICKDCLDQNTNERELIAIDNNFYLFRIK